MFDFTTAISALTRQAVFSIANEARPPAAYLGAQILPERPMESYHVEQADMTVRATMAGLSGMDSPYAIGGAMALSTFLESTNKITLEVPLSEANLRQLQALLQRLAYNGATTTDALQSEALNFLDAVIVQGMIDRDEWLRCQALATGALSWTHNGMSVAVDYGVPAANVLTPRTAGNNNAYFQSTSVFWDDVRAASRLLGNRVQAVIGSPATIDVILDNPAHSIRTLSQTADDGSVRYEIAHLVSVNNTNEVDPLSRTVLIAYGLEGEVLDLANPGQTVAQPFWPDGRLAFIGQPARSGYVVGEGSRQDPNNARAIGYTHMAPTVEAGGQPGRWAELYVPQDKPWSIVGRGAANTLPVISNPNKLVIAQSEIA